MRTRLTLLALAIALTASCALHTRSAGVKVAVGVEKGLNAIKDAVRAACDPVLARVKPAQPIPACTTEAASFGLTTAKFREISGIESKVFTFNHDTLVPALRTWQPGDAPPVAFAQIVGKIDDLVAVIRTVPHSTKTDTVFQGIVLLLDAIKTLEAQLGSR
jgi:hypothetical protein